MCEISDTPDHLTKHRVQHSQQERDAAKDQRNFIHDTV